MGIHVIPDDGETLAPPRIDSGIMAHATFDGVFNAMKQVMDRRANGHDSLSGETSEVIRRPSRLGFVMRRIAKTGTSLPALAVASAFATAVAATDVAPAGPPKSSDPLVARGRYLAVIGGCNDCHTPNYAPSGGKLDEKQWLIGDSLGWRGLWGTTYPVNLRQYMQALSEKDWVARAKKLETRPPMPWFALNQMTETDLRAIYRFVRSLGPGGDAAPAYVPPTQEPKPPYVTFPAPPK